MHVTYCDSRFTYYIIHTWVITHRYNPYIGYKLYTSHNSDVTMRDEPLAHGVKLPARNTFPLTGKEGVPDMGLMHSFLNLTIGID